jgi:hypothetical protein
MIGDIGDAGIYATAPRNWVNVLTGDLHVSGNAGRDQGTPARAGSEGIAKDRHTKKLKKDPQNRPSFHCPVLWVDLRGDLPHKSVH